MSDYNKTSKLLHRIALSNYSVSRLSFQVGQTMVRKKRNIDLLKKVFITGLARAGTTVLTSKLAQQDGFCSFTYQDMPFPLMPNVWRKINKSDKSAKLKERKHGDRIKINYQSVEEIDEYFWKVFLNDVYIKKEKLVLNKIDGQDLKLYNDLINALFDCYPEIDEPVYLSKNNNLILRLQAVRSGLPHSYFIIPFRDPLSQAGSLLNQHIRFSELQKEDPFILEYMNWLGHHEFGLNHKYFDLGDEKINDQLNFFNRNDINYWLSIWLNYYSYAIQFIDRENIHFFCYEYFCENPGQSFIALSKIFGIEIQDTGGNFDPTQYSEDQNSSMELLNVCNALYSFMRDRCMNSN